MKGFIFDEKKYGGEGLEELRSLYEKNEEVSLEEQETLEHSLLSIIDQYPKFMLAYQKLYFLFDQQERWVEQELLVFQVYSIAKSLVLDENWQFPAEMSWVSDENKPLIRFLFFGADIQWSLDCVEEAKFIYMGLLNSNPYDNLGVRFILLGILEGMNYKEYYAKFDEDSVTQKQFEWFDKKASNYKEFDIFFKKLEELNG